MKRKSKDDERVQEPPFWFERAARSTATRRSPTTTSRRRSCRSRPRPGGRRQAGVRRPRRAVVRRGPERRTTTTPATSTTRASTYPARTLAPNESATYRQIAFFGPKERDVLAEGGRRLAATCRTSSTSARSRSSPRCSCTIITWIHAHMTFGNWGLAIIVLTHRAAHRALPAHVEADPEHDRDAPAQAGDRRPEREVQGRRAGQERRDDGALAQAQGQPARRVPAGARADADLVRALRDAADGGRVLPHASSCGFRPLGARPRSSSCRSSWAPR